MVSEENVGPTDRVVRLAFAVILVCLYLAGIVSGSLGLVVLGISSLVLWTGLLKSCEPYTWLKFKTNKKTKKIPINKALAYLAGVVVLYAAIFLIKTQLMK